MPDERRLRAATLGVYFVFGSLGFAFASWASRIPQVRDRLDLNDAELGLVLLAIAAGSVVALPMSGAIVHRLGTRRVITVMTGVLSVAMVGIALGYLLGVGALVVALFVFGFANGAWDVAMNVQGAAVERRLGRSIMSRFHAGWSLGTVAGALVGAAMVALHVPVTAHLLAATAAVAVVAPLAARTFLPDLDPDHVGPDQDVGTDRTFRSKDGWREPRTLLIGVVVLAFAFAEGTGNDWINVGMIDDYHAADAVGTLAFAAFLASMTTGRWFGGSLLDRYGRVAAVRSTAVVATAGVVLFAFAPATWLGFLGVLLWGVGTSLGFPTGMSAAADDPHRAAVRVSVVASIGYCAFLSGPPLIGFLSHHHGVQEAVLVVAVLLGVAVLLTPVLQAPSEE